MSERVNSLAPVRSPEIKGMQDVQKLKENIFSNADFRQYICWYAYKTGTNRRPKLSNQHKFRLWLGAVLVRQQALTWASVDQDVCRHMTSLGLKFKYSESFRLMTRILQTLTSYYLSLCGLLLGRGVGSSSCSATSMRCLVTLPRRGANPSVFTVRIWFKTWQASNTVGFSFAPPLCLQWPKCCSSGSWLKWAVNTNWAPLDSMNLMQATMELVVNSILNTVLSC